MASNIQLTEEETKKLVQLTHEMRHFPPEHFTSENLLAWAKFFRVAPKQLNPHTNELSDILDRAYKILSSEGALS